MLINKKIKYAEGFYEILIFILFIYSFELTFIYKINILYFILGLIISLKAIKKSPDKIKLNYNENIIEISNIGEYFSSNIINIIKKKSLMMPGAIYIIQFIDYELYFYETLYKKTDITELLKFLNTIKYKSNYVKKTFFLEGNINIFLSVPFVFLLLFPKNDKVFLILNTIFLIEYISIYITYKLKPKKIYIENNTLFIDKEKIENIEKIEMKYGFFSNKLIIKTSNKKYIFSGNYFNNIEKFYKQNLKDRKY